MDMLRRNGPGHKPWSQSGEGKGSLGWKGFVKQEVLELGV